MNIIFGNRGVEVSEPQVAPVVVKQDELEIVEQEQYQWLLPTYKNEAELRLQEMRSARDLGLENQALLNAREVVYIAFRDFSEGNGLDVYEFRLKPLTENCDTGLHMIEGALDLWMMYEIDSKAVRLPQGALDALTILKPFPSPFIQEIKVLQKVEGQASRQRDYRFTGDQAFHFPTFLPEPDPLLVVKVSHRWFSVFQWE